MSLDEFAKVMREEFPTAEWMMENYNIGDGDLRTWIEVVFPAALVYSSTGLIPLEFGDWVTSVDSFDHHLAEIVDVLRAEPLCSK